MRKKIDNLEHNVKDNDMKIKLQRSILKPSTGQTLLLHELWKKHGGLRASAKKIGVPEYFMSLWRQRGKVALKKCRTVAAALEIPIYALNYAEICELVGEPAGGWAHAVRSCGLGAEVEENILKLKWPIVKRGK